MDEAHVVETQNHEPVIESKGPNHVMNTIAILLGIAAMLAIFYMWEGKNKPPQEATKVKEAVTTISPTITNNAKFTCPETEYVNCMPGPGPSNPQCAPEFLTWAKENCPGFQGGAY